jgi:hypothetical protein
MAFTLPTAAPYVVPEDGLLEALQFAANICRTRGRDFGLYLQVLRLLTVAVVLWREGRVALRPLPVYGSDEDFPTICLRVAFQATPDDGGSFARYRMPALKLLVALGPEFTFERASASPLEGTLSEYVKTWARGRYDLLMEGLALLASRCAADDRFCAGFVWLEADIRAFQAFKASPAGWAIGVLVALAEMIPMPPLESASHLLRCALRDAVFPEAGVGTELWNRLLRIAAARFGGASAVSSDVDRRVDTAAHRMHDALPFVSEDVQRCWRWEGIKRAWVACLVCGTVRSSLKVVRRRMCDAEEHGPILDGLLAVVQDPRMAAGRRQGVQSLHLRDVNAGYITRFLDMDGVVPHACACGVVHVM